MVTEVKSYKTKGGAIFSTKEEAERHETREELMIIARGRTSSQGTLDADSIQGFIDDILKVYHLTDLRTK